VPGPALRGAVPAVVRTSCPVVVVAAAAAAADHHIGRRGLRVRPGAGRLSGRIYLDAAGEEEAALSRSLGSWGRRLRGGLQSQ
jgi:hypothetical protein